MRPGGLTATAEALGCEQGDRMEKIVANDPETRSKDVVAENIERLKILFPESLNEKSSFPGSTDLLN